MSINRSTFCYSRSLILLIPFLLMGAICVSGQNSSSGQEPSKQTDTRARPKGQLVKASDGFDLWYDAMGKEGEAAIIFISRYPDEHRHLAEVLSSSFRVVLFEPRHMAVDHAHQIRKAARDNPQSADQSMLDHFANRNLDWDILQFDNQPFPVERSVADLHQVADAAGIDTFIISGYSSTSLYAQFLVPYSKRITGIIAGGFPVLGGYDYWQGVYDSSAMSLARSGDAIAASDYRLFSKTVEMLRARNEKSVYAALPGPKIVFFGSRDGVAGSNLYSSFRGGKISENLRDQRGDLERLGFNVVELKGFDHLDLLNQGDLIAARITPLLKRTSKTQVVITTELGEIEVEIDVEDAPNTAGNFLRYVDGGFYNGGAFVRTVTLLNQPNEKTRIEVIQAGIDPKRAMGEFAPISLERTKDTGVKHVDGTISMARTEPDTARSSFFICIGEQPELDFGGSRNPDGQGFAAFGWVVRGMDVVRGIQRSKANNQTLTPAIRIIRVARMMPATKIGIEPRREY